MPLEIQRIQDRVKLTPKELEALIKAHVEKETGRQVATVEFHVGRGELGASTVYLAFKD